MGEEYDSAELDNMEQLVGAALRNWANANSEGLLSELLLTRLENEAAENEGRTLLPRLATNQVLQKAFDKLAEQNQQRESILHARFVVGDTGRQAALKHNLGLDQLNRQQRLAIEDLARIVTQLELAAREKWVIKHHGLLPHPSYTKLFGVDDAIDVLTKRLLLPNDGWLAMITGIGGIGKSALADVVARRLIELRRFHRTVWIRTDPDAIGRGEDSAEKLTDLVTLDLAKVICPQLTQTAPRQQRLLALRETLKRKPHLVIVDNIETDLDLTHLYEQLGDLAKPSKFLVAARQQPVGLTEIFSYALKELSIDDAGLLLRHHAAGVGLNELAKATQAEIAQIYDVIGGNPFAIKLVVFLARTGELPRILADLRNAKLTGIKSLYQHIFRRVWSGLTPIQQNVLETMPLLGETGGDVELLCALSGLDESLLIETLHHLAIRCLVEVRGDVWGRRYGIHRLTMSFVQSDINKWEEDQAEDNNVND